MSPIKSPAFQLYASDFLTDTSEFEVETVGVYIRLLCTQWANNDLPSDLKKVARIGGVSYEKMAIIWKELSGKFTETSEGRMVNPRLEGIRQAKSEFIEKARDAGKAGAEKRWGKSIKNDGFPVEPKTSDDKNSKPYSHPSSDHIGVPYENPNMVNIALQSSSSISNISSKEDIVIVPPLSPESGEEQPKSTKSKREKRSREPFVVPTVDEVKAYCQDRRNSVNAVKFHNYYTSKGWKVGNTPMKDWKAAVRTWENNDYDNGKTIQQRPEIRDNASNERVSSSARSIIDQVSEADIEFAMHRS